MCARALAQLQQRVKVSFMHRPCDDDDYLLRYWLLYANNFRLTRHRTDGAPPSFANLMRSRDVVEPTIFVVLGTARDCWAVSYTLCSRKSGAWDRAKRDHCFRPKKICSIIMNWIFSMVEHRASCRSHWLAAGDDDAAQGNVWVTSLMHSNLFWVSSAGEYWIRFNRYYTGTVMELYRFFLNNKLVL